MNKNTEITVNRLPQPTWNRLGVNRAVISDIPAADWRNPAVESRYVLRQADAELTGTRDTAETENSGNQVPAHVRFSEIPTGMGTELDRIFTAGGQSEINMENGVAETEIDAQDAAGNGKRQEEIRVSGGKLASAKFAFTCGDNAHERQEVNIYAPENTALTVWTKVSSAKDAAGTCALRTRIYADKGSKVRLVQVNLLGEQYRYINDVGNFCAEDACVEVLQLFLGAAGTWAGCFTTLEGAHSRLDLDVGYSCRGTQLLDMNYVAEHIGKKTVSRMDAKGVLRDAGRKLFRGTIDFPVGASGAKGDETEDVLILGEDAVNQTVPLILCAEEDVEGNHGATIGRLADDVLFYMASRGLSEPAAEDLVARARIEALAASLGDDELKEAVYAHIM